MCIAILNRSGIISKETFITCYENNPDSMGFVYAKRGKLYIKKELEDVEKFHAMYEKVRKNFDGLIAIHFRIGTSGKIDLENCHPFLVNSKLALVHNGILDCVSSNKTHCDTWHFADLLKKIGTEPLKHKEFREFLAKVISPSKMVFLTSTGRAYILNFDKGINTKDNWYSNNTYKEERYSYVNYRNTAASGYWDNKTQKWIPYVSEYKDYKNEKKSDIRDSKAYKDGYAYGSNWKQDVKRSLQTLDYYDSGMHHCTVCGSMMEFSYGYCTTCGSHYTLIEDTIKDLNDRMSGSEEVN